MEPALFAPHRQPQHGISVSQAMPPQSSVAQAVTHTAPLNMSYYRDHTSYPDLPPPAYDTCDNTLPAPTPSFSARNAQPKLIPKTDALTASTPIIASAQIAFVEWFLALHDLDKDYTAGPLNGPPFYIWWTDLKDVSKSSRLKVGTNDSFDKAVAELCQSNLHKANFRVQVEFEEGDISGWCPAENEEAQELVHGTAVPSVNMYSDKSQLCGYWIGCIKNDWECRDSKHGNEHGAPGYCWIDSTGSHVGLNNKVMGEWADQIIKGLAVIMEPLNIPGIETARNRKPAIRPRGGNGPRPGKPTSAPQAPTSAPQAPTSAPQAPTPAPQAPTTTTDATALLLASVSSNHMGCSCSCSCSRSCSRGCGRRHSHCRHHKRTHTCSPSPTSSPVSSPSKVNPELEFLLSKCLETFFLKHRIDLREAQAALQEVHFTPDIIPKVSITRLCEVTKCPEGKAIQFQSFCQGWVDSKRRRR
ncbi:hypothetical protein D9758_002058 [Tetrapyrgos nigripes]|uniref:C2H2-type domain-containing protein n=1 Tax=Tetrapyrgos nigripes TaxID=182062 RepID=A0A8H5GT96_9AGAR|nr:hypothetical protein D9758_002058 [Tetrapyrgos nigripes]